MRPIKRLHLCALILVALPLGARVRFHGFCENLGQTVTKGNPPPVSTAQVFPSATVTVYITGGASGSVNTSGTTVNLVSGTPFNANSEWTGLAIVINSVTYHISSVNSTTRLTLAGSAGNQSGVGWSVSQAPAALYADNSGTPLPNPFSCTSARAAVPGFDGPYANTGTYDFHLSGTGVASPFTISAVSGVDPSLGIFSVASITDYGADPSGIKDSATAINACILAASTCFVPEGTYKTLSVVNITKSVFTLNCAAANQTTLSYQGGPIADPFLVGDSTNTQNNIAIHNCVFSGNSSVADAVIFHRASGVVYDHVRISNASVRGIKVFNSHTVDFYNLAIGGGGAVSPSVAGVDLDGATGSGYACNQITFHSLAILNLPGATAVRIGGPSGGTTFGVDFIGGFINTAALGIDITSRAQAINIGPNLDLEDFSSGYSVRIGGGLVRWVGRNFNTAGVSVLPTAFDVDLSNLTAYFLKVAAGARSVTVNNGAFDPKDMPAIKLAGASWAAGTATYVTSSDNPLETGAAATIGGVTPGAYFNEKCVVTVLSATTFTCPLAVNPGAWLRGGTVVSTTYLYNHSVETNFSNNDVISVPGIQEDYVNHNYTGVDLSQGVKGRQNVVLDSGSNNAIAGRFTFQNAITPVVWYEGMIVHVLLNHSLHAGVNTFTLDATNTAGAPLGAIPIRKSSDPLSPLSTVYASGGAIDLLLTGRGRPLWLAMGN